MEIFLSPIICVKIVGILVTNLLHRITIIFLAYLSYHSDLDSYFVEVVSILGAKAPREHYVRISREGNPALPRWWWVLPRASSALKRRWMHFPPGNNLHFPLGNNRRGRIFLPRWSLQISIFIKIFLMDLSL